MPRAVTSLLVVRSITRPLREGDDVVATLKIEKVRNFSEADARARVAAQMSREERLGLADYVIDNNGTLEELHEKFEAIVFGDVAGAAQ